jgi:hypothetical protein
MKSARHVVFNLVFRTKIEVLRISSGADDGSRTEGSGNLLVSRPQKIGTPLNNYKGY